jgi:alpha-glucosidase
METVEYFPGQFLRIQQKNNHFQIFTSNDCVVEIQITSDDIARIRYAADGLFEPDFSYAIDKKNTFNPSHCSINEHNEYLEIATRNFAIIYKKEDGKITFLENTGKIICRDEKGFHWQENSEHGGHIVKMCKVIQEGEHFYGLGDKTMHPNLRGRRVTNWAMDTYGYKKDEDPIYKSIPFYLGIHHETGYGIFFDNTFRSCFDFGSDRRNVTTFWAEGGEMNFYFIHGPKLKDVICRYTLLTGVPELPPLWALGYHQSKWSYYPEKKIKEITGKMRALEIPCDAIYFDIDYMDGFRCFTWDHEKFPNPKRLIAELRAEGFKSVVMIDPGIKKDKDYSICQQGIENGYFSRRADGALAAGNVWPGDCYFPDFTDPKVRKWWSSLYEEFLTELGVRGFWNDMNEPALLETPSKTLPPDVRHHFDGHPCSHRKAHNVYGMQMVRASYKGLKRYKKEERPFLITRAAYAGTQRYASTWTGDNIASWEHLWLANVQIQRLNVTGFSFAGSDIGGFINHPTPELYIRWVQMGIFHPFFRTHSSGDHGDQEPWSFGEEALGIARTWINLRYQFLPYLYTAFYKQVTEGLPVIQPIAVFDQFDPETLYRADEFVVGEHILVCPVLEPNAQSRHVYLPEGRWYHFFTDEKFEGKKEVVVKTPLENIPVFIKEGSVIPHFPVQQYVGQVKAEELTLHCYHGQGIRYSMLYEDAGEGYAYQKGEYNIKTWTTVSDENTFELWLETKGHFEPEYDRYKVIIHGLPFAPEKILINHYEDNFALLQERNGTFEVTLERKLFLHLKIQ